MASPFRRALVVASLLHVPTIALSQSPTPVPTANDAAKDDGQLEDGADIIVQATRSGRRVQDEAVRVEVIDREEIEEKITMRPGNIAMILSETGGLRIQVTSPALGAANVRVHGMDGRYTQLLADGLPLYGGQASSLGLLQIPPTDLGQVEVIKGAASALYGPSALGGVINLVSRRPGAAFESEALLNATSRDGQDATAYMAGPLGGDWSGSVTGGFHRQSRHDLDDDGWIDIPAYRRWTVRPRIFWDGAGGASLFLSAGAMTERRHGGTLPGRIMPDGQSFPQDQDTDRLDAGLVAKMPVAGVGTAHLRASAMQQEHRHLFGDVTERDRHGTLFLEGSLSGRSGGTAWVAGLAYQMDSFRSKSFPQFDYTYRVPAIFGQVERELSPALTVEGSGRIDFHNRYGTQFSPRLSLLYRGGPWSVRASGGRGFYAPTPFVEEIEAAGLSRLERLDTLRAETADTASLDFGYTLGPVEAHMTLFGSNIRNGTRLAVLQTAPADPARVQRVNMAEETRIRGTELLLRHRWGNLVVTGSYVFVDASEPDRDVAARRRLPLTPRHSAGVVAMWEKRDRGRVGLEVYYTGRQTLDDNPYRTVSRPYFDVGLLGELVLGKARLFVNAENILDIRQTKYDRVVLPFRAADGRWTTDVWGPTDGFIVNAA